MAVNRRKKKNIFVRYFTPFGLRQICDIIMLAAMVVTILGLILYSTTELLLPIGLGLFILGALVAIFRSSTTMIGSKNRRSPEFRHALVNTIIMVAILAVAIFAISYFFMM